MAGRLDARRLLAYIGPMTITESDPLDLRAAQANDVTRCPQRVEQQTAHCCLLDGTMVRIRVIEQSDAAACSVMLSACTPKSLYSRYERRIVESLDELAARLCNSDPRCELTVVAERLEHDHVEIIGVAQLIADPQHEVAEYAVLVADPWQNKGMGSAFADFCLDLARSWGVRRVVAEFLPENVRIIRIVESRQFDLHRNVQKHVVSAQKIIAVEAVGGGVSERSSEDDEEPTSRKKTGWAEDGTDIERQRRRSRRS
jgi:GNAT superfamily N-acetyltransferase